MFNLVGLRSECCQLLPGIVGSHPLSPLTLVVVLGPCFQSVSSFSETRTCSLLATGGLVVVVTEKSGFQTQKTFCLWLRKTQLFSHARIDL